MSDFGIWGIGVAASATAIVAAVGMFVWYSYLKGRLPLAVRYRDLENRVLDLDGQCRQFNEQLERHRQELKELLQKKLEVELETGDARAWLEKNREEIERLPSKRAEIAEVNEQLRAGKETLQKLNEELLQAQAQRLEEAERAADARRDLERTRKEMTEIQSHKADLTSQIKKLEQQQQSLQTEIGNLQIGCKTISDRLENLRSEVAREEKKLEALQKELKSSRADQQAAEQARDEVMGRKASLDQEIEHKLKDLDRLRREHECLTQKVDAFKIMEAPPLEKRLEDFLRPVVVLGDKRRAWPWASGVDGEKRCLQECEAYIKQCGFKFHSRTLRAFHTSLKTADISPLVVLAGISGTGKSQLPRLYAEAMGVHFLNVAIQPRWDSPQDLFGFYNYQENRYKATELARALRQMDREWPPKTEEDKHIQNGLLLVLLDEMNLARVEYYFSELLSKLENRNAAGSDESRCRQLAAIEIDTGAMLQTDKTRRLFVGHNVLFAGTMNEDETTQSLSDKVIDRSNMLRFGKPGELRKERPPSVNPPKNYLLHADWQSWHCATLPTEHNKDFEDICQQLNGVLSRINRPFGHRVHQAMYRYLANYPREGNWFKIALADQLEQKIVPKLRGLSQDMDEAAPEVLSEIGDVVHKTGDAGLEAAFHTASDRPVFQWSGVNREAELT